MIRRMLHQTTVQRFSTWISGIRFGLQLQTRDLIHIMISAIVSLTVGLSRQESVGFA